LRNLSPHTHRAGNRVFLFSKKTRSGQRGTITPLPDGIAVATVQKNRDTAASVEHCAFHPLSPGEDEAGALQRIIHAQGLDKIDCCSVLGIGDYQLLLVEAPEVPAAELRAAIRWRIKDLIDYHVDDAVLDVFDAPAGGARGVQDHLYVVVARAALVQERIKQLESAGAALDIIDIPELAMRNIAGLLPEDEQGVAMLYFERDRGLITLTRDNTLYLARSLEIGFEQLQESPALVEHLALEVQRSLDYYDRHFQQAPISAVALAPLGDNTDRMVEALQAQIGLPCRAINIADILECREPPRQEDINRCLLTLGAALRSEVATL